MSILALTFALLAVSPASPAVAVGGPAPRVEVAFVLDTTGSMGGLIEGAKRRIWSIARRIGEGRPRPHLRLALVAYRDRGDAYVTQVHDLTGIGRSTAASVVQATAGSTVRARLRALSAAVHRLSLTTAPPGG